MNTTYIFHYLEVLESRLIPISVTYLTASYSGSFLNLTKTWFKLSLQVRLNILTLLTEPNHMQNFIWCHLRLVFRIQGRKVFQELLFFLPDLSILQEKRIYLYCLQCDFDTI